MINSLSCVLRKIKKTLKKHKASYHMFKHFHVSISIIIVHVVLLILRENSGKGAHLISEFSGFSPHNPN